MMTDPTCIEHLLNRMRRAARCQMGHYPNPRFAKIPLERLRARSSMTRDVQERDGLWRKHYYCTPSLVTFLFAERI